MLGAIESFCYCFTSYLAPFQDCWLEDIGCALSVFVYFTMAV